MKKEIAMFRKTPNYRKAISTPKPFSKLHLNLELRNYLLAGDIICTRILVEFVFLSPPFDVQFTSNGSVLYVQIDGF